MNFHNGTALNNLMKTIFSILVRCGESRNIYYLQQTDSEGDDIRNAGIALTALGLSQKSPGQPSWKRDRSGSVKNTRFYTSL
jgi:hypothetical protein